MRLLLILTILLGADSLSTPTDSVVEQRVLRPLITEVMENVTVHQDSAITQLLDQRINGAAEIQEVPGYRVQIFSSNHQQTAKTDALTLEKMIQEEGQMPVYVLYTPPFWKVRLGNFQTMAEALEYKGIFIQQHPELQGDTYVVRDQIQVRK